MEKRIRVFVIESDKKLSEAIRYLVGRGLDAVHADAAQLQQRPSPPGRRVLSRGVG